MNRALHLASVAFLGLVPPVAAARADSGYAEQQRLERQDRRRELGLRIGLTTMSLGLASLQVGLTVPYSGELGGRAVSTIGGLAAGGLLITDLTSILWNHPIGLYSGSGGILANIVLGLPAMVLGGVGAYYLSSSPTATIATSSVTAGISLASGLYLSWGIGRGR